MYAFVHIYKTAGTTLTGLLRRNFGLGHFDTRLLYKKEPMTPAQFRRVKLLFPRLVSIAGHEVRPFSGLESVAPEIKYYTFFRDPTRRMISAVRFGCVHWINRFGWRPESDADMETFLEQVLARRGNGMTKALASDGTAASAIETLDSKIGFVGFVEQFDRSLVGLKRWMDDVDLDIRYHRLNVAEDFADNQLPSALLGYFQRVNDFADRLGDDERLLNYIAEKDAEDRKLFDHAVKRFKLPSPEGGESVNLRDDSLATDSWAARAYRNVVGRTVLPLIT